MAKKDLHLVKALIQVDKPMLQVICQTFERLADREQAAGGKSGGQRSAAAY